MPDKSPLTPEEHQDLGRELRATSARLRELCNLTVSVYGPNHRVSFTFQKLLDAMDRLRADLQTELERQFPGYGGDSPYV